MNIYTHVTNDQNKDAVKKLTNYLNFYQKLNVLLNPL